MDKQSLKQDCMAVCFSLLAAVVLTACEGGSSSQQFSVSGTVSGLTGTAVLQNNGADDLSISTNGTFTFATRIADGTTYAVTVKTQPAGGICTAAGNTGTITGANVRNVVVECTPVFTVGGSIRDLTGTVVLQNNGADDLSISTNGTFTFASPMAADKVYNVTIKTQPDGQTCQVCSYTGAITDANVTNVSVICIGPPPADIAGYAGIWSSSDGNSFEVYSNGTITPFSFTMLSSGGCGSFTFTANFPITAITPTHSFSACWLNGYEYGASGEITSADVKGDFLSTTELSLNWQTRYEKSTTKAYCASSSSGTWTFQKQ